MDRVAELEEQAAEIAAAVGRLLAERGLTLAVAESLTGGKLANQFAAAKGSGEWFAGGVVTYQTVSKHRVLKVPEGPVISEEAVRSMTQGVTAMFDADAGVAASGAGGPEGQEGQAPGTTWLAASVSGTTKTELRHFSGEPPEILAQTQLYCLRLLHSLLAAA